MSHFPLLLSLAHFGSHLPPRRPDLRGSPSGKVGTIPRAVGCACAVCDPDDERGGDDLDSFWREQTPEEREAISAAYVKAYGDRPYGDQSHAMSEP